MLPLRCKEEKKKTKFLLQKPDNLVVYDAIPVQPGNYAFDFGGHFDRPIETFEEDLKPIIRDCSIQPCSLFPDEQIGCGVQNENSVNMKTSKNNVFLLWLILVPRIMFFRPKKALKDAKSEAFFILAIVTQQRTNTCIANNIVGFL